MSLDFTECDQARLARDAAYDGRFYTGVRSTGIYCRPVCPVRPACRYRGGEVLRARRQQPFASSDRRLRGAIVRALAPA